jgi:hypothetical protein
VYVSRAISEKKEKQEKRKKKIHASANAPWQEGENQAKEIKEIERRAEHAAHDSARQLRTLLYIHIPIQDGVHEPAIAA